MLIALQQKIANREEQMLTIDLEDIYKVCLKSFQLALF